MMLSLVHARSALADILKEETHPETAVVLVLLAYVAIM
jgi:hypothetical protein